MFPLTSVLFPSLHDSSRLPRRINVTFRSSTVTLSKHQQYIFGAILFFLIALPIPSFADRDYPESGRWYYARVLIYVWFALYFIAAVYTVRIFYTKFLELIEAEAASMQNVHEFNGFNERQKVLFSPIMSRERLNEYEYMICDDITGIDGIGSVCAFVC